MATTELAAGEPAPAQQLGVTPQLHLLPAANVGLLISFSEPPCPHFQNKVDNVDSNNNLQG